MTESANPNHNAPRVLQVIAIAMLLWALLPINPYSYSYYILLRFVVSAVCAYLAFQASRLRMVGWTWILGLTAVLYNPFFRIHLDRGVWSVINIATIGLLAWTIWALRNIETPTIK
jgi:hypothetical protein